MLDRLDDDAVLTVREVADLLKVSAGSVRRALQAGKLKGHRVTGGVRVGGGDLRRYVAECELRPEDRRPRPKKTRLRSIGVFDMDEMREAWRQRDERLVS